MPVYLIADTVGSPAQSGLGLPNLLLHRQNFTGSTANLADPSPWIPLASAVPVLDALAPPPVKANRTRTARRTQRKRRTRRRSDVSGDSGKEFGFFGGDGEGPFGGGSGGWGGDGGSGWNFGGFGEQDWDESSSWSRFSSGFAYGFIYEVIYWIALSNCVHFAFKKLVRIMLGWIADGDAREKVPNRLTSIC